MNDSRKSTLIEFALLGFLAAAAVVLAVLVARRGGTDTARQEFADAAGTVVLYKAPATLRKATAKDMETASEKARPLALVLSADAAVTANGHPCDVYETNVNLNHAWAPDSLPPLSRTPVAIFDFNGQVTVEASAGLDIQSVTVSPLSRGIQPEISADGRAVRFTITQPDNYTLYFNGAPERAMHIFAGAIEENPPQKGDPNVVYVGPGEYTKGVIRLTDGQTLYLAGGAVVHGCVLAEGAKDVKVMGRGIIDGSKYTVWTLDTPYVPLQFNHCQNVELSGVTLLNPNAWCCQGFSTTNLLADNIKIISCRANGDGVTLQSCVNAEVKNCFLRTWDDSLVVKNYEGNTDNLRFHDDQIWTDLAQSMEIGYETNKGNRPDAVISNVSFDNITVLHNFHKPVISIHNTDNALVTGIRYNNIVVEDCRVGQGDGVTMPYLIDISIFANNTWTTTKDRGQIRDVAIDGLTVLGGVFNYSRIEGADIHHTVEDVTIRNMTVLGKKITNLVEAQIELDRVATKNITLE